MEGIERLEMQAIEMNNSYINAIFQYLKTRTELYDKFKNEEKSIKQMYEYIYNKADNLKQDNVAMVDNRVVYIWAINYFNKSNDELGIKEKKAKSSSTDEGIKEIKKKEIEQKEDNKEQLSIFQEVQ